MANSPLMLDTLAIWTTHVWAREATLARMFEKWLLRVVRRYGSAETLEWDHRDQMKGFVRQEVEQFGQRDDENKGFIRRYATLIKGWIGR
jgi:hypothetical protein